MKNNPQWNILLPMNSQYRRAEEDELIERMRQLIDTDDTAHEEMREIHINLCSIRLERMHDIRRRLNVIKNSFAIITHNLSIINNSPWSEPISPIETFVDELLVITDETIIHHHLVWLNATKTQ